MSTDDSLPAPCPQCGTTLETRDDALVHVFQHWGDDDIDPLGTKQESENVRESEGSPNK